MEIKTVDRDKFWHWPYSDFLSNTQRGVLAEFIVAQAVGATDEPRKEWDAYDITTPDGLNIEVKSAAFLQRWNPEDKHSKIRFDISNKVSWQAETNTYIKEPKRSSDLYVFCLYAEEKDKSKEGPLQLDRWEFWICPTDLLNDQYPKQKTISLNAVRKLCAQSLRFHELGDAINKCKMSSQRVG